ncbi:MAG: HlyD family secretion protein [bacterium]|nr:HlyD family secretion protein [bacterium]MCM1376422.1 HlyD family secretion protein [Muribaculum sp.]
MDRKRKAVVVGFCLFLAVMGICSLVTKGIYMAGLPRVTTTVPKEMSLYHEVSAVGAVETGQEYGVYAPSGLRIAAIGVQKGDSFSEGDGLLQLDVEDLEHILDGKELERQRLSYQEREAESQSAAGRQDSARTLSRAQEDLETEQRNGEVQLSRAREDYARARAAREQTGRELDQARRDLEQHQKEPVHSGQPADGPNSVSGGDNVQPYAPESCQQCRELENMIAQLQAQASQQDQTVIQTAEAAQDMQLSHESRLQAARRSVEDARAASQGSYQAAVDLAKLERDYLESEIAQLQELVEAQGWIRARESGKVTRLCVGVGERTPDTAQLLYTPDDGLRQLWAELTQEQAKYVSMGTRMQLDYETVSSGKRSKEGIVSYLESQPNGGTRILLDVTGMGMDLGQQVSLKSTWQSESFDMVVPLYALHRDGNNSSYVYTLRQENGILGVEWHVSVLYVEVADQNERYAALRSAGLSPDTAIILTSSAELKENQVVRVVE